MIKKTNSVKNLSAIVVIAMIITNVMPMVAFAAITPPMATATVTENDGGGQTKTINVTFNEEVVMEDDAALDTDILVEGKTFGSSELILDPSTQKDLIITLADDADVEVGDSIKFQNYKLYEAADPTMFFNDSVEVGGCLDLATIDYSAVTPEGATIVFEGYAEPPVNVGVGTFNYEISMENYVTYTGVIEVTEEDLGNLVKLEVALEENGADYKALDEKVAYVKENYMEDDYTASSFADLQEAIDAAINVDRGLTFSQQSEIDDLLANIEVALSKLESLKEVSFIAAAIADDANKNYAKATKVVLVFAEPIDESSDILSGLSIKDSVSLAQWIDDDNTVYELTLNENANLENGTIIAYTEKDENKTKFGAVIKSTQAEIVGNLEGAGEYVTATGMMATIVKMSAEPEVVSGDKIVIVFNAPVMNNPEKITVTSGEESFEATVVAGTSNTIYEIILEDSMNLTDSSEMAYEGMVTSLNGTFGKATAPIALRALAVDKDGTALVEGDEIVVLFDMPTNGVDITDKLGNPGVLTGIAGANFGSNSVAEWDENNTKLVITIGDTATVANGVKINLSDLGIMDQYGLVDAVIDELDVEGSFGYTVNPRITKAVAFTQNDMDYIRVFFNTEVKAKAGEIIDATISGFTMGASATKNLVDMNNGLTYYEISMAKEEHSSFESGKYSISLTSIVDKETGTKELSSTPVVITGAFISPITPEVLKAVAISNDGSGVAKPGDKIIAVFNIEVTIGEVSANDGYLGTGYSVNYSAAAKNVIEIVLGDAGLDVTPGTTAINFSNFKDEATESVVMADAAIIVSGGFGYSEVPEIMSATAISADGSGTPKAGDKIVVVFNTMVTYNGNDIYYYEYILNSDGEYNVGDTYTITVTSKATGIPYELSKVIEGSFGYTEMPTVKSVVLSEADGAETITVVFDRATNRASIDTSVLFDNNSHLGQGVAAAWSDEYVLKISLAATSITTDADKLNLSGLGIKAADNGKDITGLDELTIVGTLIPVVKTVVASGKNIEITFSARTNGIANISNLSTLLGTGSKAVWTQNNRVLTITLGENYTITNNGYIVLNGMGIYDAFSGKYHVVGQYKVLGSIDTDRLAVSKVVAQSTDKSNDVAQKGDTIIVKFNSSTDLCGAELNQLLSAEEVDAIVYVEGGNEEMLGTGYTGEWTSFDTLVITLGGKNVDEDDESAEETGNDPAITVGTVINISGVSFANGEGLMDESAVPLSGTFNGREFVVTDGSMTRTSEKAGDYRISMKVEDTMLNPNIIPTIVCVAFNGNTPVSVMRMSVDIENSIQPVFEFSGNLKITNAKIYVFGDLFSSMVDGPDVLAETYEIK